MAASGAISSVVIGAISVMAKLLEAISVDASLAGRVVDLVSLAIGIDGSTTNDSGWAEACASDFGNEYNSVWGSYCCCF